MTAAPPAPEDLAAHVERIVIGADYGADGYTTLDQADDLARRLRLRPGERLLELGSGRGWPGLYLAQTTCCHVTLTDLPLDGLRDARQRAAQEGLADRCHVAAAEGAALPFAADAFDAIVHADVMC